jgi:heat shock protein HtpX
MALGSIGLQTYIWNNNLRSLLMLIAYPFIVAGFVWLCLLPLSVLFDAKVTLMLQRGMYDFQTLWPLAARFANDIMGQYWPFIFGAVGLWFLIAYVSHTKIIQKMSRAHSVSRKDEPELYNLLENLCIVQGVPMPKLHIIETHARNAFASGLNWNNYTVTVTRGLMNSLQKDELEAVLAHELAHIINNDVRTLMITVVFTGMFTLAVQILFENIRYSRYGLYGSRKGGKTAGQVIFVIAALFVILAAGCLLTMLLRFAISRRREYVADAGAVEMTKNPEAMMRALMRISGRDQMPAASGDVRMMCVENSKRFFGVFSTHPPIHHRLDAIASTNDIPVPALKSLGPAHKGERISHHEHAQSNNPWLTKKRRGA